MQIPDLIQIDKLIRASRRVLVTSHRNPDGDAVGSVVALSLCLQQLGKETLPIISDSIGKNYNFLDGIAQIRKEPDPEFQPDLLIAVDSADLGRLYPSVRPLFENPTAPTLNIDHHPTNTRFASANFVEPTAASTSEILFMMMNTFDYPVTPSVANALYVGLIVDTGGFAFQNTTPSALRNASELVRLGAQPYTAHRFVFNTRSGPHLKLLGRVLEKSHFDESAGLVYAEVTRQDLAETGAHSPDFEGIPEFLLTREGAKIAILFAEGRVDHAIRISFRSHAEWDVSQIAAKFGGGGHRNAAGALPEGSLEEIVPRVLKATYEALGVPGGSPP
jgi:phosphoesterase RecJ-like protein